MFFDRISLSLLFSSRRWLLGLFMFRPWPLYRLRIFHSSLGAYCRRWGGVVLTNTTDMQAVPDALTKPQERGRKWVTLLRGERARWRFVLARFVGSVARCADAFLLLWGGANYIHTDNTPIMDPYYRPVLLYNWVKAAASSWLPSNTDMVEGTSNRTISNLAVVSPGTSDQFYFQYVQFGVAEWLRGGEGRPESCSGRDGHAVSAYVAAPGFLSFLLWKWRQSTLTTPSQCTFMLQNHAYQMLAPQLQCTVDGHQWTDNFRIFTEGQRCWRCGLQ